MGGKKGHDISPGILDKGSELRGRTLESFDLPSSKKGKFGCEKERGNMTLEGVEDLAADEGKKGFHPLQEGGFKGWSI